MSSQTIQAYLALLQEVLSCKASDSTDILQAYSDVWSEDLLCLIQEVGLLFQRHGTVEVGKRLDQVVGWLSLEMERCSVANNAEKIWMSTSYQCSLSKEMDGRSPTLQRGFQGGLEEVLIVENVTRQYGVNGINHEGARLRDACCQDCSYVEEILGIDIVRLLGDLSKIKGKPSLTKTEKLDLCFSLAGYSATDIAFKEYEAFLDEREKQEVLDGLKQDIDKRAEHIRIRMSKTVNAYINCLMGESGPRKSWARIIFWLKSNGYSKNFQGKIQYPSISAS